MAQEPSFILPTNRRDRIHHSDGDKSAFRTFYRRLHTETLEDRTLLSVTTYDGEFLVSMAAAGTQGDQVVASGAAGQPLPQELELPAAGTGFIFERTPIDSVPSDSAPTDGRDNEEIGPSPPTAIAMTVPHDGTASEAAFAPVNAVIGLNFQGRTVFDSGFIPPDTMGTVGPDHIVEIINGSYAVYDKITGTLLDDSSLDAFWINAGVSPVNNAFDPRVLYDPGAHRFYATSVDNARGDNNILFAISNTDNPLNGWTAFAVDSDSDHGQRWADFPQMGYDDDGMYIGVNMFDIPGGLPHAETRSTLVLPKASLLAPTPSITGWTLIEDHFDISAQPVAYPNDPTDGLPATMFNTVADGAGFDLTNINGPVTNPSVSFLTHVPMAQRDAPPPADQPSDSGIVPLETGDGRVANSVTFVNGSYWGVHAVEDPSTGNAAIRFFEVAASGAKKQEVFITHSLLDLYYPSVAVNDQGRVAIGFTASGDTEYPSAYAVTGQTSDGVTSFASPFLLHAGTATYENLDNNGRNRWGDYSATVVDPSDSGIFWTFQEYSIGSDNWATRIVQIITDPVLPRADLLGIDSEGVLYEIDSSDGDVLSSVATPIAGPVGLAQAPNGEIYTLTGGTTGAGQPNSLYLIDPQTGGSTLVSDTGLSDIGEGDLDFDPTTGVLYGAFARQGLNANLFTIDPSNGQASIVGTLFGGLTNVSDASAMAFNQLGELYLIDTVTLVGSFQLRLRHINKSNAGTISSVNISGLAGPISADNRIGMDFDPVSGELFVWVHAPVSLGFARLYTLDPDTGVLTDLGPSGEMGLQSVGLQFLNTPPPPADAWGIDRNGLLFNVDRTTGEATHPRNTGLDDTIDVVTGPDGGLYTLTGSDADRGVPNALYRMNVADGTSTLIGSTGLDGIVEGDFGYDESTGLFYGVQKTVFDGLTTQRHLFTVDPATGTGSLVGQITASPGITDISSLGFDWLGRLQIVATQSLFDGQEFVRDLLLWEVDKSTGQIVLSRILDGYVGELAAIPDLGLVFDPVLHRGALVDGGPTVGSRSRMYDLFVGAALLNPVGRTRVPLGLSGLTLAAEPSLLGIDRNGVLYGVDPVSGAASRPRVTGLDGTVGLTQSPSGSYYTLTSNQTTTGFPNHLFTLDPVTGAAMLMGATGLDNIREGDIDFDPATDMLYGVQEVVVEGLTTRRYLFTIDPATGAATIVGQMDSSPAITDISALAFDDAGNLYVVATHTLVGNTNLQLLQIDKATAGTVSSVTLSGYPHHFIGSSSTDVGMDFDPNTGTLYVVDGGDGGTDMFYALDPDTGVLTTLGPTGAPQGLAGLQFVQFGGFPITAASDFGDAPAPYPTLKANDGARHGFLANAPLLGDLIDSELDGMPNSFADGDDNASLDDEDGIAFAAFLLTAGSSADVDVTVSNAGGLLNAWVDFNADGDWSDSGEQIFTDLVVSDGVNDLQFMVPLDAAEGLTFTRFRVSTQSGISFDGEAHDGEVEDYQVNITNPAALDGDLDIDSDVDFDDIDDFIFGLNDPAGYEAFFGVPPEFNGDIDMDSDLDFDDIDDFIAVLFAPPLSGSFQAKDTRTTSTAGAISSSQGEATLASGPASIDHTGSSLEFPMQIRQDLALAVKTSSPGGGRRADRLMEVSKEGPDPLPRRSGGRGGLDSGQRIRWTSHSIGRAEWVMASDSVFTEVGDSIDSLDWS